MAKRTCIITGETDHSSNLLRFVISPDGSLVVDLSEKLPGRGAYLISKPEYLKESFKKNKFAEQIDFQKKLSLDEVDAFTALVGNLLKRRFVERLSLARMRGIVIAGAGRLRENRPLMGLLISNDASVREARKLESLTSPDWVIRDIPAKTLGEAFGRNSVAYVGLRRSKNVKSEFHARSIQHSFQKWKPFIHVIPCQEGTDGCINETDLNAKQAVE